MDKIDKLKLYNESKKIESLIKAGVLARRRIGFNDIIYFETQNLIERFKQNNQQKSLPEGTITRIPEAENAHQKFVKTIAVMSDGKEEQRAQEAVARKKEEQKVQESNMTQEEQNNDEMEIV